ncbi:MAG: agmatine deiminase family protein [Pseudomonadota bacterium]
MDRSPTHIPPEWGPQRAVWAGWPYLQAEWGDAFDPARSEIETFLKALSKVTPVRIACGSRAAYGDAYGRFADVTGIGLHTVPSGDIWLRDTGPIFARQGGGLVAHLFRFNGWGGKYDMVGDTLTAGGLASVERAARIQHGFVVEGGALDFDGAGRVLTTRQCLLHPNRNPGWGEAAAETALRAALGVGEIIWLGDGLTNDHTDGHVDNLARFIGPGRALCQTPNGPDDPNAIILMQAESALRAAGLEVVTIPSPGRIEDGAGQPLPASHMNFLISNGHIFLPSYGEAVTGPAVLALQALMPDYKIIALPARAILSGGGAFHCMTQQVPEI